MQAVGAGQAGASTGGAPQGGTSGEGGLSPGGDGGLGGMNDGGGLGGNGGNAGTTAGLGGNTTGGASGSDGGGGSAGSGNGGAAGTGGTIPTLDELVGELDGFLIQFPCTDNPITDDCSAAGYITQGALTPCSQARIDAAFEFDIGGTLGQVYAVNLHFYGITSPKNYGNHDKRECERQNGGQTCPPQNNDDGGTNLFYVGDPGQPYAASTYETREIHVYDQNGVEIGTYFLNSDYAEGHYTYVLNYERTIPVVGGGRVRFRVVDLNCRHIKNCGSAPGYPCANKARTVDISAASPQPLIGQPPAGLDQPGLGETADHAGQWVLIDATGFTTP